VSKAFAKNLDATMERADRSLELAEQAARELIAFADGAEEAGLVSYAQKSRAVARDLLSIAGELRAERSARIAIQKNCELLRDMVAAGKLRIQEEWRS
jgi:hypothetical protein